MRPIERGDPPDDPPVTKYDQAKRPLMQKIGGYCSFCERPWRAALDVEHIQPQKKYPELIDDWNNFLLACKNCNSIKGDRSLGLSSYFWPDRDNTFLAFSYEKDMPPKPSDKLTGDLTKIAEATIDLTGLDRIPGHPCFSYKDYRWEDRNEAWRIAEEQRRILESSSGRTRLSIVDEIIVLAQATGFWSVWMTVFKDNAEMRRRLIHAFPGTAESCFDTHCMPIARSGGQI